MSAANEQTARSSEGPPLEAPAPPPQRGDWRPKLRWFAAEIGVVVAGVLIALALNAWWAGLQETRQRNALTAAVADELVTNIASLGASVERHRAILEAIAEAQRDGSTEAVHQTAVIERELWEAQTAALETFMAFQSQSDLAHSERRVRLGEILERIRKYQERELRAALFQDRARERIADLGLRIYDIFGQGEASRRSVFSDQVMLNYLTLRWSEEAAAIEAAAPLSARMEDMRDALSSGPDQ
ncbi:MAG: hypothetical protein GVY12_14365 [Bacteroidetes bacterium]|nr:hypothetical protein [Bacteroidota bacterium]